MTSFSSSSLTTRPVLEYKKEMLLSIDMDANGKRNAYDSKAEQTMLNCIHEYKIHYNEEIARHAKETIETLNSRLGDDDNIKIVLLVIYAHALSFVTKVPEVFGRIVPLVLDSPNRKQIIRYCLHYYRYLFEERIDEFKEILKMCIKHDMQEYVYYVGTGCYHVVSMLLEKVPLWTPENYYKFGLDGNLQEIIYDNEISLHYFMGSVEWTRKNRKSIQPQQMKILNENLHTARYHFGKNKIFKDFILKLWLEDPIEVLRLCEPHRHYTSYELNEFLDITPHERIYEESIIKAIMLPEFMWARIEVMFSRWARDQNFFWFFGREQYLQFNIIIEEYDVEITPKNISSDLAPRNLEPRLTIEREQWKEWDAFFKNINKFTHKFRRSCHDFLYNETLIPPEVIEIITKYIW